MAARLFRKIFFMVTIEDKIDKEMLELNQNIYTTEKTIHSQSATLEHDRERLRYLQEKKRELRLNSEIEKRVDELLEHRVAIESEKIVSSIKSDSTRWAVKT